MKKALLIVLGIIGAVVLFVALLVLSVVLFEPVIYGDYYADAKQEFALPGKSDGFVQQGFTYSGGKFLTGGYMPNGDPSRIYITGEDGESAYVSLKDESGKDFFGHVGGIASYSDSVLFVCGDEAGQMLTYSMSEVLNAGSGGSVKATGGFTVHCSTSFCYVEGTTLYVGEFYREQNYPTDTSHHKTTPAGDKNHAVILAYGINPNGTVEPAPNRAYSAPDLAQGMCITASGKIIISTSYGFASSHLYMYKLPDSTNGSIEVNGADIPLWYLDSASLEKDVAAPPMTEELVYLNGRVYVMGESASNKYMFGKILRARNVWSCKLD